jgi:hypothetical protein
MLHLFRRAGRPGRPDPEALFADLARAQSGRSYSDAERYRDFRAVFLGNPIGRKVLYEILTWANMFRPAFVPGDPFATHYRDGERNVGLKILAVLNAEPLPAPATALTDLDHSED